MKQMIPIALFFMFLANCPTPYAQDLFEARERLEAEAAIAEVGTRMAWAENNGIDVEYPIAYRQANALFKAANIAFDNEKYDAVMKLVVQLQAIFSDSFMAMVMAKRAAADNAVRLMSIGPSMSPSGYGVPGFPAFNTSEYSRIHENGFLSALDNPISTFSIDVDTASYANVRGHLTRGGLPPKDAVRTEELVNYFNYSYPVPEGKEPVAAGFALSQAPWDLSHLLLRVSLKAKEVETSMVPASNLVFLIDTSGSMYGEKLRLIKESLKILVDQLRPEDRVSIVAYAGRAGLLLDATPGSMKDSILSVLDWLEAGGSTAGGEGINLAYDIAKRNFITGGNNRVILCTDGDFNVGVSSTGDLERLIEERRKDNIFLTVVGVGYGNLKDSRMEALADKGNGNYAYIDNLLEGKKVFSNELWGNLYVVAKDVKIQIEFNPAKVKEFRLIGYENRLLAREDFNDDRKDAGEMGSGHAVTAFYELVPVDPDVSQPGSSSSKSGPVSDPLTFQQVSLIPSESLLRFRLRYKLPGDGWEASELFEASLTRDDMYKPLDSQDDDFRFAAAVVEFGMLLRDSEWKGSSSWQSALALARSSKGQDPEGYRAEFIQMLELGELIQKR